MKTIRSKSGTKTAFQIPKNIKLFARVGYQYVDLLQKSAFHHITGDRHCNNKSSNRRQPTKTDVEIIEPYRHDTLKSNQHVCTFPAVASVRWIPKKLWHPHQDTVKAKQRQTKIIWDINKTERDKLRQIKITQNPHWLRPYLTQPQFSIQYINHSSPTWIVFMNHRSHHAMQAPLFSQNLRIPGWRRGRMGFFQGRSSALGESGITIMKNTWRLH